MLPGVTTAAMLAVLVSLGTWQVHRLAWKAGLLADMDRAEAAPAVPLPAGRDAPPPFAKVWAEGTFHPGTALYGAEVRTVPGGQAMGADLLAVLDRAGAAPIVVDLGWVTTERPLPPVPSGTVRVDGYARPAEAPVLFGAKDDPAARRFYALDPGAVAAALGMDGAAPFTLVAMGPAVSATGPVPATALPRPPNNHLQYALTWYGFALTLTIVFLSWCWKALRA